MNTINGSKTNTKRIEVKGLSYYDVVVPKHIPIGQWHRYATRIVKGSLKNVRVISEDNEHDGGE
jgi:hypothetical protein